MKCAAEFIMMKKEAIAKHEAELETICAERRKNAIELIETVISDGLAKRAVNRQSLEVFLEVSIKEDEAGKYFKSISWWTPYADGTRHGIPAGPAFDYTTFVKYLKKYCIDCSDGGAVHKYSEYTKKDIHYYNKLRIFIPIESNRDCGI